jgi:hypothetical protein
MTYTGIVENGMVKLPPDWKDGTPVQVETVSTEAASRELAEKLIELSRKVKGLPRDLAENHDHYLHGTPKR